MTGPLSGLRVLDLTRFVSGSYATMVLAGLGADVVKVESAEGDPYRAQGASTKGGDSPLYRSLNTAKRSVVVDFRKEDGREVMERLLGSSAFFVENSRPGRLARHGLDYESVHERHPSIVYGSISGYGDVGPDADKGGFDLILQAETGIMSVTGTEECGPVKVGAPLLDIGAGMTCVAGLLAAHAERLGTGVGRHVSTSLLEFSLAGLSTVAAGYLAAGAVPGLLGTHSPSFAPYGGFRTADGWLVLAGAGSEDLWRRSCAVLGVERLAADERFADNASRLAHRHELTAELEAALAGRTTADWLARFQTAGVPAARVKRIDDVLDGPQVSALGMIQHLETADRSTAGYDVLGVPLRFDRAPLELRAPAPLLGEDTADVLEELGYDPSEMQSLAESGVVAIKARRAASATRGET